MKLPIRYTEKFLPMLTSGRPAARSIRILPTNQYVMADNIWNEAKSLILWTAWRHYVSRPSVRFMLGTLFMICRLCAAVISSINRSQLQLVSGVLRHGTIYFRATYVSAWHVCEGYVCMCLKDKVYKVTQKRRRTKRKNISRQIANISSEQLQRVHKNLFHQCEEYLPVEGQHFFNASCYLWIVNSCIQWHFLIS
jgi:hypothetical protein